MKAFLKNYRQSPRKVSLVTGLIKGKRVAEAFTLLNSMPKRASGPIINLLKSAVANAKQSGVEIENLFVGNIMVNKGVVLKRIMPRARGSASRINKRTSHVTLTLVEKNTETKHKEIVKTVEKKETKTKVKKSTPKKTLENKN